MAYAPLPKLLPKPADTSKMCPIDWTKSNLSSVLQSDAVRRLFNQPNIVIKTVPSGKCTSFAQSKNAIVDKKNGLSAELSKPIRKPDISIVPLKVLKEEFKGDISLLQTSKIESRSEIALLPINSEKKECGHCEPCENIICDVAVHQYVDREGASLMLATTIDDDDEINAPVSKHCSNVKCDALSIDHNRCRRAMIKLYRFDRSRACDICGITLKYRKSRVHHKNCVRKDVYRHNKISSAEILKERMREREIQILEATKAKRSDYSDPVLGTSLAMEALKKNGELIIIPKTVSVQKPSITITAVPSTAQSSSQTNNVKTVYGKVLPNVPVVVSQRNVLFNNTANSKENSLPQQPTVQQVRLPDIINTQFVSKATNTITIPQNQIIRLTGASQSNAQPISINDWLISQPPIVTTPTVQPKPILTPIRVVPITNLITQPSLLHQTQGIPKFCIMADNAAPAITISNPRNIQTINPVQAIKPLQAVQSVPPVQHVRPIQPTPLKPIKPKPPPTSESKVTVEQNSSESKPITRRKKRITRKSPKRKMSKKQYRCNYCLKRFSTGWYFGVHVATHKSDKRYHCKYNGCAESFINRLELRKHGMRHHKNERVQCDVCNYVCDSYMLFERHAKTHKIVNRSFECSNCNTSYQSQMGLDHHSRKCPKKPDLTDDTLDEYQQSVEEKYEMKTEIKEEYEIVDEMTEADDVASTESNDTLKTVFASQPAEEQVDRKNKGFVYIPANIKMEIDNIV